jgi:hypothetical protein
MEYYSPKLPCDPAQISRFRKILGEAGVEQLLKTTIEAAVAMKAVKKTEFERVIVDTTVQEKAIAHPTDARLLDVARQILVGHTLAAQIEQTATLLQDIGTKPTTAIVDLGYRGVDQEVPGIEVIHRGKAKRLTAKQQVWLRRRQAIEPVIGHAKADHRMDRCWLKGAEGDALHAVLCAAGFNIRWLMRAIVAQATKAAKAFFLGLLWLVNLLKMLLGGQQAGVWRVRAAGNHAASARRVGGWPSHGLADCSWE